MQALKINALTALLRISIAKRYTSSRCAWEEDRRTCGTVDD